MVLIVVAGRRDNNRFVILNKPCDGRGLFFLAVIKNNFYNPRRFLTEINTTRGACT